MTKEVDPIAICESLIGQKILGIAIDPDEEVITIMTDHNTIVFEGDDLEMYVDDEVKQ